MRFSGTIATAVNKTFIFELDTSWDICMLHNVQKKLCCHIVAINVVFYTYIYSNRFDIIGIIIPLLAATSLIE